MIAKSLLVLLNVVGALESRDEPHRPEDEAALKLAEQQLEQLAKEELFAHYAAAALQGLVAANHPTLGDIEADVEANAAQMAERMVAQHVKRLAP